LNPAAPVDPADANSVPADTAVADVGSKPAASEAGKPAPSEAVEQSKEIDLQVEYVQLVDSGDTSGDRGPMYRVWIVNHGKAAIAKPFDVVLVATNDDAPSQESPYGAERVTEIGAGQRLSVEIRLPVEVLQLSLDTDGLPVPFKNLFAAVDVQQELAELNEQNNALGVARADVPDASLLATAEPRPPVKIE
jgi:hypothetical protein